MLNLAELNLLDREKFTRVLGPVFEHSPWIAERTWSSRPFPERTALFQALRKTVMDSDEQEKLALIRAHPDLVGKAALTTASQCEQAAAGLGDLSSDEVAAFHQYNEDYREKFGFPFVICARENKKAAILAAFPQRLQNSREVEIEMALREIFKIAQLRLQDILA
jgi:2-oxo-4-hydroxy-4-carboxy-5-ureidoimidazoline decarboxylase